MPADDTFAVYFSQSWRPHDVDLNLQVWKEMAHDWALLVDTPQDLTVDPPYYINRIEELLRRSDLFVSVLTHRGEANAEFTGADANLRCSPWSLFEIRLAERAGIPGLVLYERSTGFRTPRTSHPGMSYVAFDRGPNGDLIEGHQWDQVIKEKIELWMAWVKRRCKPKSYEQSTSAAMLVDFKSAGFEILEQCLLKRYDSVLRCDPASQRSSEAIHLLRESGLVLAEFGDVDEERLQLYAAAHALGLPAVRMLAIEPVEHKLPWILRGDPGGYQHDIVAWMKPEDLLPLVEARVDAMFRLSPALRHDGALDYLQSKRYSQFFVFISHTLKPPKRELVDSIFKVLKQRGVKAFEYHQSNVAGQEWREVLNKSLRMATHFIVLLSDDYEKSPTCTFELDAILARGNTIPVLPFMVGGRNVPHPRLSHMHNMLLSTGDASSDAGIVVDRVLLALDQSS